MILRISIIDQSVPFLVSKFVFKRLGAKIGLDDNDIEFKRFPEKHEPIYDLKSGHVAIQLLKGDDRAPEVPQEALTNASMAKKLL